MHPTHATPIRKLFQYFSRTLYTLLNRLIIILGMYPKKLRSVDFFELKIMHFLLGSQPVGRKE